MDQPTPEPAFELHSNAREQPSRGNIVDVTDGPDAIDPGLTESPLDQAGDGLAIKPRRHNRGTRT